MDVDYVPNFFATKMNRKSTGLIGVVVPYLSDLFFTSLIESMEKAALRSDYMLIIQTAHGDPELEARAARNLMSMSVDGVVIAPIGQASSHDVISQLQDNVPLVFVDSRFPDHFNDVDFIGTDNVQSMSLIITYLCRSGESPAFLGMPRINSNSLERDLAYRQCMTEHGFKPEIIPAGAVEQGWEFEEYAFRIMDDYFSRGQFTERTLLCANDRLAIGAIRAANKHKLFSFENGKPGAFKVAGHDNHPLSAFVHPALTTVSRNTDAMGQAAIEQVLSQIQRGKRAGVTRLLDTSLCVRESA